MNVKLAAGASKKEIREGRWTRFKEFNDHWDGTPTSKSQTL